MAAIVNKNSINGSINSEVLRPYMENNRSFTKV